MRKNHLRLRPWRIIPESLPPLWSIKTEHIITLVRADILVFETEKAVKRFSGAFIRADKVKGQVLQRIRQDVTTEGTLLNGVIKRMQGWQDRGRIDRL